MKASPAEGCCVRWIRGQPDGERNVDQLEKIGATRNTHSAHSKFSENTQTEKMVDGSGKPDERNSSNAQIRTLLEEQRQTIIKEYREKSVITNSMQLTQKKSADSDKDNYGDRNWNSVKLINKFYRNGRITEIPEFYLRYDRETKTY